MTSAIPFAVSVGVGAFAVHGRRVLRDAERLAAATLETLLNAVDANDAQTGMHVRRVATYALIITDALGVDEHERRAIERIALFHDIGKIHEALFDIIHETTRLTPEERRAIATHPQRGAEVLAPLATFYPELPEGVLTHHERWDGSGYPRGLKGRRIPFATRIVSIADTFDAVAHSRRYRAGAGVKEAERVIAAGRGTQFDPELVDLTLLPPVLDQLVRAKVQRPPSKRGDRRSSNDTPDAPDVRFRWRSEALGTQRKGSSDERR